MPPHANSRQTNRFHIERFAGLPLSGRHHSTVIIDAVLMSLTIVRYIPPFLPNGFGGIPISEVAGSLLALIATTRQPKRNIEHIGVFISIYGLATLWAVSLSLFVGDGEWYTRALRLLLMGTLAAQLALGQIDILSGIRGMFTLILINAGLFYANIAPHPYGKYLTGYLEDKNRAALYIVVVGIVFASYCRKRSHVAATIAVTSAMLWATGSRTTLAGMAAAIIWIYLRPHLKGIATRIIAIFLGYQALMFIEQNFARSAGFEDRAGSDHLRALIDTASWEKIQHTPWYGGGLGNADVTIEGKRWFFHNSYWALFAEGGWPLCFLILGLFIALGLRFRRSSITTFRQVTLEAATLSAFVAALHLGEVFFAASSSILLGALLAQYLDDKGIAERDESPELTRYVAQHHVSH